MKPHVLGPLLSFVAITFAVGVGGNGMGPGRHGVPDLERGSRLYDAHCIGCHGGATGGLITDVPPPHNANGHTWHHPDCELIEIVLYGSDETVEMMREMRGVPEDIPLMPAFEEVLSEEEVWDVLAHIKTWWADEQREQQARITRALC